MCLHNEETNPGVLACLSLRLERPGSFLVSCSRLDNSGFEEEDDGRERKWLELHDESKMSLCFSPAPVQEKHRVGLN